MSLMLFQISGSGAAAIAGVIFFLIFVAVAYIVLRMLRKTVKMAVRLGIVAVILVAAVAGTIAVWYLSSAPGETPKPRAPTSRQR